MSTDTITSGWQADPTGRHELRYHDGDAWTEHVADGGKQDTDPYDGPTGQSSDPDAVGPTPPATRPDDGSATATTTPTPDPGATFVPGGGAGGASAPASTAAWPTGNAGGPGGGASGAGGGGAPDWTAVPPPGPAGAAGGGSRRSTGRRIGLVLLVLALMAVSAIGGFVAGLAVDVGDAIDQGLSVSGTDRVGLDEATPSGVELSGDAPRFDGTVDGPTSFTVVVARAGQVAIEVEEADFDTYITLHDETGQVVAEDDDGGTSAALLSRIDGTFEAGTYTLVLDSWTGGVDAPSEVVITVDLGVG